jgi:hypothetical protein
VRNSPRGTSAKVLPRVTAGISSQEAVIEVASVGMQLTGERQDAEGSRYRGVYLNVATAPSVAVSVSP